MFHGRGIFKLQAWKNRIRVNVDRWIEEYLDQGGRSTKGALLDGFKHKTQHCFDGVGVRIILCLVETRKYV